MSRSLAVLRPEPGNAATAARVEAAGYRAIRLPLFDVRSLEWTAPDSEDFDGLLVTSANAVRHAGTGLTALRGLPVIAVGARTADAARSADLRVDTVGEGGVADALSRAGGRRRLLHLAGRDHLPTGPAIAATIMVYASEPVAVPREAVLALDGSVALLHSARAARRLVELAHRAEIAVAALSDAVAEAAGSGWRGIAVAAMPNDDALIAAAATLAD